MFTMSTSLGGAAMSEKKPTVIRPTSLNECIDLLIELDQSIERDDEDVTRELLRALIADSGWLSDFDDIFEAVEAQEALDLERVSRWARWQLGNLRLEAAIDDDSLEEETMERETKPYTSAVARELVESSVRTTAQRNAMRPETGTHSSLEERTEDGVAEEDDFSELDVLLSEIVEDEKK